MDYSFKDDMQLALIRKGLYNTSDIINKEYIEDVVYKKSDEYLTKRKDDELEDFDSEKCGKPKYIQSLPGDLRSTNPSVLKERLDAIDDRLKEISDLTKDNLKQQKTYEEYFKELEKDNKTLQKNIDEYEELSDKVYDEEVKLQGKALDEASELKDSYFDFTKNNPEEYNVSDLVDEKKLNTLMGLLGTEFEDKGLLYSDEVDAIKRMADDIEVIAGSFDSGYNDAVDEWIMNGQGLADDLRDFADRYDVRNCSFYDDLSKVTGLYGEGKPTEWSSKIQENNTELELAHNEYDDLVKERKDLFKEQNDLKKERSLTASKYIKVK